MLCRSLLPLLRPLPRLPLHGPVTARPASELATLRKATGYSLSICKKALGETGNDVAAAEQWLRDQAQQQGWAKAQKLQVGAVNGNWKYLTSSCPGPEHKSGTAGAARAPALPAFECRRC